jgi:hypothetical protein
LSVAAVCRLTTADPYHPGTASQPGMSMSRGISESSLIVAPYRSFPSPVTDLAGTTVLGLSRGLRTQPIRNRSRTPRWGQGRTQTRSYVFDIRRTSYTSSLTTCGFVSQQRTPAPSLARPTATRATFRRHQNDRSHGPTPSHPRRFDQRIRARSVAESTLRASHANRLMSRYAKIKQKVAPGQGVSHDLGPLLWCPASRNDVGATAGSPRCLRRPAAPLPRGWFAGRPRRGPR